MSIAVSRWRKFSGVHLLPNRALNSHRPNSPEILPHRDFGRTTVCLDQGISSKLIVKVLLCQSSRLWHFCASNTEVAVHLLLFRSRGSINTAVAEGCCFHTKCWSSSGWWQHSVSIWPFWHQVVWTHVFPYCGWCLLLYHLSAIHNELTV